MVPADGRTVATICRWVTPLKSTPSKMTSTSPPFGASAPSKAAPPPSRTEVVLSSVTCAVKSHKSPDWRMFGSVETIDRYVRETTQTC